MRDSVCELLDMNTKSLGRCISYSAKTLSTLVEEAELTISGKMVVLDSIILPEEFVSGRLFLNNNAPAGKLHQKLRKLTLRVSSRGFLQTSTI